MRLLKVNVLMLLITISATSASCQNDTSSFWQDSEQLLTKNYLIKLKKKKKPLFSFIDNLKNTHSNSGINIKRSAKYS